jgi:hypothetical protein
MPGLDPGIHHVREGLDCRIKSGNDEKKCHVWKNSSPAAQHRYMV